MRILLVFLAMLLCLVAVQGVPVLAVNRGTNGGPEPYIPPLHGNAGHLHAGGYSCLAPSDGRGVRSLTTRTTQPPSAMSPGWLAQEGPPSDIQVHRAVAYMGLQVWDKALGDLDAVGEDVHQVFQRYYPDVPTLESQLHVELPWQIVECLAPLSIRQHRDIVSLKAARDNSQAAGDPGRTVEWDRKIKSALIDLMGSYT